MIHEKGFELCLACGEYSKKKKKVDIAAAAVYSVIQGAQNFKQWFLMGSRLPLVGRRISQCLETFSMSPLERWCGRLVGRGQGCC